MPEQADHVGGGGEGEEGAGEGGGHFGGGWWAGGWWVGGLVWVRGGVFNKGADKVERGL